MAINLKNSTYNIKNGRYTIGGITEVSPWGLELWEMNELKADPSDIVYYIEPMYENKPYLLGYMFYGDEGLWWVVCQYNGIIDPLSELITGKLILVPTIERVRGAMFTSSVKTGGVQSTRKV
jgi:hypothetical protein